MMGLKRFSQIVGCVCLSLLLYTAAQAINPPKNGKFPEKVLQLLRQKPQFITYGSPGLMKQLARRKALMQAPGKTGAAAPTNFDLPVLLGSYADKAGQVTKSTFQSHLFGSNPTGSLIDYYDEVSYSNFNLTGDVHGWFTAPENQSYYVQGDENGLGSYPNNGKGFVRDIVEAADGSVDFSQYDLDGDGKVTVMVVYAGEGPDENQSINNIWPHQSRLGNNAYSTDDDVTVDSYVVCPELEHTDDGSIEPREIGVYAHEFGHALGLPDLYDTDASAETGGDSEGIGEWGLMGSGSWGGDGNHEETPAHMTVWSKIDLGWIQPDVITSDETDYTIANAEQNAVAVELWEDGYKGTRYFLLANRQQIGFDEHIHHSGLIIYHVDEYRSWGTHAWGFGPTNDYESHKLVDVEAADGLQEMDNTTNRGDPGDVFPGDITTGGPYRTFNNSSDPNSKDYGGDSTGVSVTNISESSQVITVDISPRKKVGNLVLYDQKAMTRFAWGNDSWSDVWGGVHFSVAEAGTLKAIDVGFHDQSVEYEVKVYDDFNEVTNTPSSQLGSTVTDTTDLTTWHTIAVDDVVLPQGEDFFVSVRQSGQSRFPIDNKGSTSGNSYVRTNGTDWNNVSSADLNIRARIKTEGTSTPIVQGPDLPGRIHVTGFYPHPIQETGTLRFELPDERQVILEIYDVTGRRVRTIVDQSYSAGTYQVDWDPGNLATSVYLYRFRAGEFETHGEVTVIR